MKWLECLALGLAIGGVSGLLGIGGGVLLVPALMYLFGVEQAKAAGITLAVLAVPVVLPGAWRYHSRGLIDGDDLKMAGCIAVAFAIGTYLGADLQAYVPLSWLRLGFGFVMIYIAVRFIVRSDDEAHVAFLGVSALLVAWSGYIALRALGRKYPRPLSLGQQIQAQQLPPQHEDYNI